jgi:V/A-type H+-transporting ATPase subunit E
MKGLESGKDKVKKICEVLKKETLEPAKREAEDILQQARLDAQKIIEDAQQKAEMIESEAKKEVERQKNVFQSSLSQACKQSIESLKQEVENHLFNKEMAQLVQKQSQDPKIIAQLITAVVEAIQKEGLETDISAYISSSVSARDVNALIASQILSKLKEKEVVIGSLHGGVAVKLYKENITLDISDVALKELVSQYVRKDFRELLFAVK